MSPQKHTYLLAAQGSTLCLGTFDSPRSGKDVCIWILRAEMSVNYGQILESRKTVCFHHGILRVSCVLLSRWYDMHAWSREEGLIMCHEHASVHFSYAKDHAKEACFYLITCKETSWYLDIYVSSHTRTMFMFMILLCTTWCALARKQKARLHLYAKMFGSIGWTSGSSTASGKHASKASHDTG